VAVGRHVIAAVAAACLVTAGPLAARPASDPATARTPLVIGVDDDHAKWLARPDGLVAKYRELGVGAVRVTIGWRGQRRPNRLQGLYVHRAASLVARGQRVVLAVFGRPQDAPTTDPERRAYCDFLHHVLVRVPFRDVQIWNEANSPQFWPQAAGPAAYEALLATCWRRLHGLRRAINVIGTTAAKHDPAGFVRALGAEYRAHGRTHPLVDTFGHNPYPSHSSEPPWAQHADPTVIGMSDLPRLLAAIRDGFAGTAQPLPGERRTSVWYLEVGFQTTVPRGKRRFYHGTESDAYALPPAVAESAEPWVRDQVRQLRDAVLLASCQPEVGAVFNFLLLDEDRLVGWQSGLLWRDGSEKPAFDAFREVVRLVAEGAVDCSAVPGAGGPLPERPAPSRPQD